MSLITRIANTAGWLVWTTRQGRGGQAYTEYSMIVVVIGIVMIASLTFMGNTVHNLFQNVSVNIQH